MLHFKLSKATVKTLASFHGIKTVSNDVIGIFENVIISFVENIVSRALKFAIKRSIPVKRLYIEDVQNACKIIFNRRALTLVDGSDISKELQKKLTPDVIQKWEIIMKPDDDRTITAKLQLHHSPFHKLITDIALNNGFDTQIGSDALLLIQNETEYFLFAALKEYASIMKTKKITTLSSRILSDK